ncbi:MAG: type I-B CRISPR-associated protein Cas7/Cst2/DevR [Archaeoglobaceae archaeon]|nr:type I-B CRISPR-associated protein Cas7/Cst2/DevR [Archaeoglobaceae archaeon]
MKCISAVWLSRTDLTNLNSGEGEANFIDVKKYKKNGVEFPYVSGQAMRYYFKEAIRRNLGKEEYMCVPNEKGETCGDISKCVGCDLFGFMTTIKKGTVIPGYPKGHPGGAITRVSPLKVSPAIGLLPFDENSVVDFLTRRHRFEGGKMEGDIVNVEIGTNIYKCGFAIDFDRVGGEEKIDETRSVKIEYYLQPDIRKGRASKVIEVLRFLSDYSKQARLLTDFTPDLLIIAFQNKYSHRIQKAFDLSENSLDINRLEAVLKDVKSYSDKIIAGIIPNIIENEDEVKSKLSELEIKIGRTDEAINEALEYLKNYKIH